MQDRIDWYGAYDFTNGKCCYLERGGCNGNNTIKFLRHLAAWLEPSAVPTVIIWDGAIVSQLELCPGGGCEIGFTIVPLPGYSPISTRLRVFWKWMREDVTRKSLLYASA
ncbi:MAG: hypothetical protein H6640_16675 [Caldilineaceae bacterium]|nr:hypothetical protein [Caldilineaceae bacterium]